MAAAYPETVRLKTFSDAAVRVLRNVVLPLLPNRYLPLLLELLRLMMRLETLPPDPDLLVWFPGIRQ